MAGDVLSSIEGILFDLDDTLISKADWTVPALEFAAGKLGLDAQAVWELGSQYVVEHGTADAGIYNHILLMCGQSDSAMNIRALAAWANQFEPAPGSINLMPGALDTLLQLNRRYRLGLIADGTVVCQQAKLRATGLDRLISVVVFSDNIEGLKSRKPDPRPYREALAGLGTRAARTMFVGDHPVKDFIRARTMGMVTVRIMKGEYKDMEYPTADHAADYELISIAKLPGLLEKINNGLSLQPPLPEPAAYLDPGMSKARMQ